MKKRIAIIALVALIAAVSLSLVACGSNVAGTYKFQSMEMKSEGMSIKLEADKEVDFMGTKVTIKSDAMTLELKKDKTFTVKGEIMDQKMDESGTWEEKDGKIILTMDGEDLEATLEKGVLTFEVEEGMTISFKK